MRMMAMKMLQIMPAIWLTIWRCMKTKTRQGAITQGLPFLVAWRRWNDDNDFIRLSAVVVKDGKFAGRSRRQK